MRLRSIVGFLVVSLVACTVTPIPIPGTPDATRGPILDGPSYQRTDGGLPSPKVERDGTKQICDLCPPGTFCPNFSDADRRDGAGADLAGDGLAAGELGPVQELGPQEGGAKDGGAAPDLAKDLKPGN